MIVHGKQKLRGKRNNGDIKEPEDKHKMAIVSSYISITILNVMD